MLIPCSNCLIVFICNKVSLKETKVKKKLPYEIRNLLKTYYDKTTFKIKDEKDRLPVKKYNEQQTAEKRLHLHPIQQKKRIAYKREELLAGRAQ
jgi:hypothetical protein